MQLFAKQCILCYLLVLPQIENGLCENIYIRKGFGTVLEFKQEIDSLC